MNIRLAFLITLLASFLFGGAACGILNRVPPDGGVYVSPDRGETFVQRNFIEQRGDDAITLNFANILDIAFHPVDPNIVYVTTDASGIYKTTNAGAQWQRTGITSGAFTRIVIDRITPSTLYATDGRRIYKSLDGGGNWLTVYIEARGDQQITDLTVDPRSSSNVLATTSTGGVLLSNDFGGTWIVQQWLEKGIRRLYAHPLNPEIFYVLTTDQHLMKTTDAGKTFLDLNERWKTIVLRPGTLYVLAFRDTAPDVLYLGTTYGLLTSIDGGMTWAVQSTLIKPNTVPITHILLHPDDALVMYFVAGRTIHRSFDGGEEWAVRSIPTSRNITRVAMYPGDASVLFFGTQQVAQ